MYYDLIVIIIMVKKYICLILLVVFISIAGSKKCDLRTVSGVIQQVCCADYEATEHDCVACPTGYTSEIGQHCKPCLKNTYGERCRYECSCLKSEMCDNVEGCVEHATTTDTSVHARSSCSKGYTSYLGQRCQPCPRNTFGERCRDECTCSGFEICDHVEGCVDLSSTTGTSVPATTFKDDRTYISTVSEKTDSKNELVSREIIAYYIVPLSFVIPGIFLCFFFYKFKIVDKMKKAAMTRSKNPSLHLPQHSKDIEMEESLYDIMDDTDMLGYVRRMLKSTDV